MRVSYGIGRGSIYICIHRSLFNAPLATRPGAEREAKGGIITISNNTYGYIRVSTREQNEDRQLIALREMSIPEQNIFMDKLSGKDFNTTSVQETGQKTRAGRFTLYQEHRPTGAQL